MARVIRAYFEGFDLIKSSLQMTSSLNTHSPSIPTTHHPITTNSASSVFTRRSAFKSRPSIVSFDQTSTRRFIPPNNTPSGETTNQNDLNISESARTDLSDSFDEYLKFSYDHSTNEIIGSSLKPQSVNDSPNLTVENKQVAESSVSQKYRTTSFGLLSEQYNENEGILKKKLKKLIWLFFF